MSAAYFTGFRSLGVLTATAGWVDVCAFFDIEQVFPANQSGNTILLAAALVYRGTGLANPNVSLLLTATALAAFCVGAGFGGWLTQQHARAGDQPPVDVQRRLIAPRAVSLIAAESVLLIVVAGSRQAHALSTMPWKVWAVTALGLAMGLQGAFAAFIAVPSVTTIAVTGTLTKFLTNCMGTGRARDRSRLALVTWCVYFSGAALATVLLVHLGRASYWPPAAAVTVVTLRLAAHRSRTTPQR